MYTWEELEQFVNNCRACPLCRTRKHPVMGRGDHKGKLMLVAEAPGSQEDLAGIPFVGPSGKVLDELLAAAQSLIDPDYRISRQHGTWIERRLVGKKRREKVEKNKKSTCIFTRYPV